METTQKEKPATSLIKFGCMSIVCWLLFSFWGVRGGLYAQAPNQPGAGNALSFDGVNNRVEFSTSINNVGNTNTSLIGTIIGRWYGCPGSGVFSWMLNYNYGKFVFNLNNSQISGTSVTYNGVEENTYYHQAVTCDASFARMYVNGVFVGNTANPGGGVNTIRIGIGKELHFP